MLRESGLDSEFWFIILCVFGPTYLLVIGCLIGKGFFNKKVNIKD